jgi:AraC family transcriptional regulator
METQMSYAQAVLERADETARPIGRTRFGPANDVGDRRNAWRRVFYPAYRQGTATQVHIKAWTGLAAVVKRLEVDDGFEADCTAPFSRLLVVLDEVGGRLRGRLAASRGGGGPAAPANAMYFVPAGMSVWAYADKLRYVRHISLQFTGQTLESLFEDDVRPDLPASSRMAFSDSRLLALARVFEADCLAGGPCDRLLGDGLSVGLFSLLSQTRPPAPPAYRGGLTDRQLRAVRDHVEAHLCEAVDSAKLARLAGVSPSHFQRAFKVSMGKPPHQWLVGQRIVRAQELLLARAASLAQVALDTGFSDQPHFTRVFSRIVGASPGAWRRSVVN